MQARMRNPALVLPEALQALQAVSKTTENCGVPPRTLDLVKLRASQINGCSVCALMHARDARKEGETDERLSTLAAWRDAPFFTEAERAALALTEAATRIADRAEPVPDAIYEEVARQYDEPARAALVMTIAMINLWNRLNVVTRQVAGRW